MMLSRLLVLSICFSSSAVLASGLFRVMMVNTSDPNYLVADFDGSDDYIENNLQVVNSYPFTIIAWFKTSTTGGAIFIMPDKDSAAIYYGVYVNGSGNIVLTAFNGGSIFLNSDEFYNDGEWHHVSCVFTSNTSRDLYVDGDYKKSNSTNIGYNSNVDRFSIGRFGDSTPSNYMNGYISDVRVYSVALTPQEISDLYTGTSEPSAANLAAHWPLEGDADDISINSNDGIITGATFIEDLSKP